MNRSSVDYESDLLILTASGSTPDDRYEAAQRAFKAEELPLALKATLFRGLLTESDPRLAWFASIALGELGAKDEATLTALRLASNSARDKHLRAAALRSRAKLKDQTLLADCALLLAPGNEDFTPALAALRALRTPEAIGVLVAAFDKVGPGWAMDSIAALTVEAFPAAPPRIGEYLEGRLSELSLTPYDSWRDTNFSILCTLLHRGNADARARFREVIALWQTNLADEGLSAAVHLGIGGGPDLCFDRERLMAAAESWLATSECEHALGYGRFVILRAMASHSYEESTAAFEKLQADILVGALETEAPLTRRLIANDLFDLALQHKRPFTECTQLFEQLREVGFSYLGPKVSAYYAYVEECLILEHDALAARYGWEIVAELSSEGPLSETLSLEDRLRSIRLFAAAFEQCRTES